MNIRKERRERRERKWKRGVWEEEIIKKKTTWLQTQIHFSHMPLSLSLSLFQRKKPYFFFLFEKPNKSVRTKNIVIGFWETPKKQKLFIYYVFLLTLLLFFLYFNSLYIPLPNSHTPHFQPFHFAFLTYNYH